MESSQLRKLYVQLDPIEKIHRTEVRRARALHYLQRRAIDADIVYQQRVEEALQLAQEEMARLRDDLKFVQPQTPAASAMAAKIERAEAEIESLRSAVTSATAVSAARRTQQRDLVRQQDAEDSKLNNDFQAQMAGRDLEMTAPVLKMKVQGVTIPVNDEALPPLVEIVKAAIAEMDDKADGEGEGDGARGAKRPAPVEEEEEAEAEEEGAGAGASGAADKKKSRRDRRTPEEDQNLAARTIAGRYTAMKPCAHCGAHARRDQLVTCGECHRLFCGQGDRSPAEPRGQPCIDLVRCRCGMAQCYDCYLGADTRTNSFWLHCVKCDKLMCPLEWGGRAAECQGCGIYPACRSCRDDHDPVCPRTLSKAGFAFARGDEEESEDSDEESSHASS